MAASLTGIENELGVTVLMLDMASLSNTGIPTNTGRGAIVTESICGSTCRPKP